MIDWALGLRGNMVCHCNTQLAIYEDLKDLNFKIEYEKNF